MASTEALFDVDSRNSKLPVVVTFVSVLLSLVVVVFSLRFYIRLRLVRSVGVDDWVIFLALVRVIFEEASRLGRGIYVLTRLTISYS